MMQSLDDLNRAAPGDFLSALGDTFELAPWVAEAVAAKRPFATVTALHEAMMGAVRAVPRDRQLDFLRGHPDLAGKAARAGAVTEDSRHEQASVGLDVRQLYAFTFGVGAACVGAAGALMITIIPVTPFLAAEYTLLAFVIVIVGGLGSMTGALAGGLLIGVSEAVAGLLLQPSLKSMVSFGILILVLLLRPQGLFGKSGT